MTVAGAGAGQSVQLNRAAAISASFVGLLCGHPSVFVATATIFFTPLAKSFGWGLIIPSLMYVASLVGIAIASVWVGKLVVRFGAARVVVCSSFLLAGVLVLLGLQTGSAYLAIGLSFLAGVVGAGTNLGVYMTILPKWFDEKLGRALGLAIVGISVGAIIMTTTATKVINTYDWRTAYFVLAAAHLSITLVASALLSWLAGREARFSEAERRPVPTGATLAQAMGTCAFWMLGATISFASLGVFGIMPHLFPLYLDRNITQDLLPIVAVAMALGTLIGRILSGLLLDLIEGRSVALMIFCIGAIGILWLAFAPPGITILTAAGPPFLIGMAMGAESDIIPYMVRRTYGLLYYPVIYNRLLVAHYVGAITGTIALGWAYDNLSDSNLVVAGLGVSCLAACGLASLLPSTRAVESA
jgi:MFS family permease